mgnify:CR=1 FL=1
MLRRALFPTGGCDADGKRMKRLEGSPAGGSAGPEGMQRSGSVPMGFSGAGMRGTVLCGGECKPAGNIRSPPVWLSVCNRRVTP